MANEQGTILIKETKAQHIVQDMDYEIFRPYDNNYKPSANPRGGLINFTILSPNEFDHFFHNWMNKGEKHNARFRLPVRTGHWSQIDFEDAYCVRLSEYYSNSDSGYNMLMRLTISAPTIKFGVGEEVVFTNNELKK